MKTLTMFETSWCPYCKQAHQIMQELKEENPKYQDITIKIIDEEIHPEIARKYDYYYVPTFFLDTIKLHEGVPSKNVIRDIFDQSITS